MYKNLQSRSQRISKSVVPPDDLPETNADVPKSLVTQDCAMNEQEEIKVSRPGAGRRPPTRSL